MKNLSPILRALCLMMVLCLTVGCVAVVSAEEEPLQVTMYLGCLVLEYPPDGNEIEKTIEDYIGGVDFKINAYSQSVLHEMMPTLIAGGDLPMVVNVGGSQLSKSYMITAMKSGEFWDVTDYLNTLENFKDLNPACISNYAIDGRNYGLPLERGISREATTYRYDWLQNLGMEDPTTVEELVTMLKRFTTDDPDGNGIDDTYGTVNDPTGRFAIMLGAPLNWRYEDGHMLKAELTEEYTQALDISRELYAMGAIHPEYTIRERADIEGDLIQGKAGAYFNTSTDITAFQSLMVQPEAVLHASNIFANEDGNIYTAAGRGNNGALLFSTKAIPDKETLDKVINIFDRLADQEMCNLLALGVEGKNYEVVNGVAHMLPDEDGSIKNFYTNSIYNPYTVPMAVRWPNLRTIPAELDYGAKRNLEIIEENAPYAVADPTLGLTSELYLELGPDLDTLLGDAKVLYIMGQIDRDEYLKRVEQWRVQGGDDIAADYARLYEEKNG